VSVLDDLSGADARSYAVEMATEDAAPEGRPDDLEMSRQAFREMLENLGRQADVPVTVTEIESSTDDDLDDRVWMRLSSIIDYSDAAALRAEDDDVAAYLATRVFEWEVGNGGLHQYFFNFPDPAHLSVVLDGYTYLGLDEARRVVEELIAPLARVEAAWRGSLRDGTIETFFASYPQSQLPDYDDRIEFHDDVRMQLMRERPHKFAR
jgi:Domain of unknown function (DUF4375)